jgi:hypothetical protein
MKSKLFFFFVIVIPFIVFLVRKEYFYAGLWCFNGIVILFLETKQGKKIKELLF